MGALGKFANVLNTSCYLQVGKDVKSQGYQKSIGVTPELTWAAIRIYIKGKNAKEHIIMGYDLYYKKGYNVENNGYFC